MEDFMPDVPQQDEQVVEEKEVVVTAKDTSVKMDKRVWLLAGIVIFLAVGIVISILESIRDKKAASEQKVEEKFELFTTVAEADQMVLGFYMDVNGNGQYDYPDTRFKSASVEWRRPGEELGRAVPADVNGQVIINDLPNGSYEIRFVSLEDTVTESDDWRVIRFFETSGTKQTWPTEWEEVTMSDKGFSRLVGVVENEAKDWLVVDGKTGLKFYRGDDFRLVAENRLEDDKHWQVKGEKIYYADDNKLFVFDPQLLSSNVANQYFGGVPEDDYYLSPDGQLVLYVQDKDWSYLSTACGEGGFWDNDLRLQTADKRLVSIYDANRAVIWAAAFEQPAGVYLLTCKEEKLEAARLDMQFSDPTTLTFLSENELLVSDSTGSYFVNLTDKSQVKYEALGGSVSAKVEQGRYIVAKKDSQTIVVDYPAVKASGVEKHYLIPVSEGKLIGDVFYSLSVPLKRYKLLGNGAMEELPETEVFWLAGDDILGLVKVN